MVSIVIPVYNGHNYIKRCLDSIFSVPHALEVIAVNDGSSDDSLLLLKEFAKQYPQLKIVDKPQNEGLPQAKKTGLEYVTGEYVAFLDVDDWVDPTIYSKMEQKALSCNADLVFCDYVEEYPNRSVPVKSCFDKEQVLPMTGTEAMRYVHQRRAVFTYPWNKLYRTELLRTIDFPYGNFVGEDYYVLLRFLLKATCVDYVDEPAYHYVLTDNSMSRAGYSANTVRAADYYKEDYELFCSQFPERKKDITNYLMIEYMAFIVAMGRNKTYDKQMLRDVKRFVRKGLFGFTFSSCVSFKMKGSAIALCISYRLLIAIYRLVN